jgi:DNA repair exonuclease SbcCD nuclease subunit
VDGEAHTYPGNPDPLEFGEEGERGVVLAEVRPDGRVEQRRVAVALSRVHDLRVDVTGCGSGSEIRERVRAATAGLDGVVRVTLVGELAREIDFRPDDVETPDSLEALQVRIAPEFRVAYDLDAISQERTVRGQFVRDVQADDSLAPEVKRSVIVTGLRALEARADLEAL